VLQPLTVRVRSCRACDSCRLRRVKCDKADKEGGDCSECARKAIQCVPVSLLRSSAPSRSSSPSSRTRSCTDTYVKNKPKVVRGGKLINQAKCVPFLRSFDLFELVELTRAILPPSRRALYGDNGQSPGVTSPPSPVKNEYELQEDPRRLSASTASINATSPSARLASLSLGHDLGDRASCFPPPPCPSRLPPRHPGG